MATIVAGDVRLETRPVEVRPIVEQALAILELAAERAEIGFRSDGVYGVTVRADPDRLRQVLIHLLDNAIKYGPSGSEVSVSAQVEPGARRVAIRVSDRGPGLSAEEAEEVFLPYRRVDRTAGGKHGIGLGLSLARSLARLMSGTLELEPGDGTGATFVLRLPLG